MSSTQQLLLTEGGAGIPNYIEDVFSTYLYNGNGSTQNIVNGVDLSTKGGMVWLKDRSGVPANQNNNIVDTIRGVSSQLITNSTAAASATSMLASFNATGFSLGAFGPNAGSGVYASWTFRKQPKFFDVVTYTGTGSARTIAHSLGSAPGCIMVKRTDTTSGWNVYHRSLTSAAYEVELNTDVPQYSDSTVWNSTAPTSTVFSLGTNGGVNASGGTYVAYLFAHNAGGFGLTGADNVISCGSFSISSGVDSVVNLGYEPQWLLIKKSTSPGGDWRIIDNMRGMVVSTSTSDDAVLYANTSAAEALGNILYPTATGFTVSTTSTIFDVGATYIYIAIRRGPMKVPTDGTTVYNTDTFRSTTANPNFKFGFVTDLKFSRVKNSAQDWGWNSRLTGATGLISNSLAGEYADTNTTWDFMNGVGKSTSAVNSQNFGWGFKRAPQFFDEVCYTGTGSNLTLGHNLGVVPELIICKSRSGSSNWWTFCSALGAYNPTSGTNKAGKIQATDAFVANSVWDGLNPTSTQLTVNSFNGNNGSTYLLYLFATCPGVSKVGSYTGNATLTTINCGFTGGARFVMIKRTDSTGDWCVWNTTRGMVAGTDPMLPWNATTAEANANSVYTTTTGFQLLASPAVDVNTNGATYIYLAIA